MTLDEYIAQVAASEAQDWTSEPCWGAGSGPSYRDSFIVRMNGKDEFLNLEVKSHSNVAAFKKDLSITLAWGLKSNDDYYEEWANGFPNKRASSCYLDFFYNGALVLREILVVVDGGRCYVPQPERVINKETDITTGWTLAQNKFLVGRFVNALMTSVNYDSYIQRAGIEVIEVAWPT